MKAYALCFSLFALLLVACGAETPPKAVGQPTPQPGKDPAPADHGAAIDLGTLTLAGKQLGVVRLGELVPGRESAFEVHPKGLDAAALASLNVYLWVESQDGTQLSAAAKGSPEGKALHFHVTPRQDAKTPFRVVLRLRADGTDERASLPLDGHGHEHRDGPHHGVPASFRGGGVSGHLELKLHDDKGDLELWLYRDSAFSAPLDLSLAAAIEIEFIDHGGRKVSLRPRNQDRNEDEDGTANVRDGRTNYFIFPSHDGEDAAWLMGKQFQSIVLVRFAAGGEAMVSEEFVLKPHVH